MKKNQWLWMIPILLLATAISTAHLADDAIWFDEWITYFITATGDLSERTTANTPLCGDSDIFQAPFLDMICLAAIDNSWPPAFFSLLWFWGRIVSFGALLIDRTLALFIGLISISVLYRLGKSLFDEQTGLVAALLLGTSAFFIHYMHEVRGYTLYVLMGALTGWLYWRLLKSYGRTGRAIRWGFVASITIALYTHYIAAAGVLGIGIYHVLFERPSRNRTADSEQLPPRYWSAILKLWVNGCLMFTPWIAVLIVSFINESATNRSLNTITLLDNMLYGFSNNLWWIAIPSFIATGLLRKKREIKFLWVWAITILFVSILGNIFADFLFHPRHIMGLMPAFILLFIVGIGVIVREKSPLYWIVIGIWAGVGIISSATPRFMDTLPRHISTIPQSAMDTIVETANTCINEEDDLVVLGVDTPDVEWVYTQPATYYLPENEHVILIGLLVTDERENESPLLPDELREVDIKSRVQAFTESIENIWVFTLPDLPLEDEVVTLDNLLMEEGYIPCTVVNQLDVFGRVYSQGETCEQLISSCR